MSLPSSLQTWNNLPILPEWTFLSGSFWHTTLRGLFCHTTDFATFYNFQPDCSAPKEWLRRINTNCPSSPASHLRNSDSCNEWLSTFYRHICEQLFYYPLLIFHIIKCGKVEMRESAAYRIALLITFATYHFHCADQLRHADYSRRAGRFRCSDNFHFTSRLWSHLLLSKSVLTGPYPTCHVPS